MQLIPDATKTAILQPYIGVGKGLIPSSVSLLNWVGNNQHDYSLCSMFLYVNLNCKITFDMLIKTWRTTQENNTTTRTKRAPVLAN
jgi:hypothetical protein